MRKLYAEIEMDEEKVSPHNAPIDLLERYFRFFNVCFDLKDALISDADDSSRWARYIDYLIDWAFSHRYDEFEGMSPASFEEWADNKDRCMISIKKEAE